MLNYEYFKYLHLGLISNIKRKSLPEISHIVNVSSQNLHHFLTSSDGNLWELEKTRLQSILNFFIHTPITIIIDETGDRKKGNTTDYTSRQYLGNVGKVDHRL